MSLRISPVSKVMVSALIYAFIVLTAIGSLSNKKNMSGETRLLHPIAMIVPTLAALCGIHDMRKYERQTKNALRSNSSGGLYGIYELGQ